MREIVHTQVGQCGNQIGSKVTFCSIEPEKKIPESKLSYFEIDFNI